MGNRFGGLKQMLPVGPAGELLLDYSIFDARRAGFSKVVFVVRREFFRAFRDHIGARIEGLVETGYVFQELTAGAGNLPVSDQRRKPWGTGHALLTAREEIQVPFCVINADDYYGPAAYRQMVDFFSRSNPADNRYLMVGYPVKGTLSEHGSVSRGVCEYDDRHHLARIREIPDIRSIDGRVVMTGEAGGQKEIAPDHLVSMNIWGLKPGIFFYLSGLFEEFIARHHRDPSSEFYIPSAINRLLKDGKITVKILPARDRWFGLTYREDLPKVVARLRSLTDQGFYPDPLYPET